jgi:type IV secretion system protein TrbL
MTPDTGILTALLNKFLLVFAAGPGNLQSPAGRLLLIIGAIEVTLAALWWALKGENVLVGILQKLLLLGLFFFFVESWIPFLNSVLDGFVWAGFTAGGSNPAAGATLMKDPSAIISQAFVITGPLEDEIHALSWYEAGTLVLLGWAYIFTILAFFVLAIQVFITYLEFYLVAALSLILVPFGVFKHTAFVAERAFGSVVSFGVKLMVLAFIIAAAGPILSTIALPTAPTLQQAYMVLLAALAIAFLAWHAPGIAAGMISGGPSLTAGSAAGFAASTAFGVLAGAAAAESAARAAGVGTLAATRAAAEGLGTASMGARLGNASAQLGGATAAGRALGGAAGAATAAGKSAAEFVSRPIRSAGSSIAEAYARGELRAWKPSAPEVTTPGSPKRSAASDIQAAVRSAQAVRSVIPPENHGGSGLQAPIRPE